jgi:hypothetical protein
MSWKHEIKITAQGPWQRSYVCFAKREEAEANVRALAQQLVLYGTRLVHVDEPANHRWVNDEGIEIEASTEYESLGQGSG